VTAKQQLVTPTPIESSKVLNMESAPSSKLLLPTLILQYRGQQKETSKAAIQAPVKGWPAFK